jgi:hypothetical protein
VASSKSARAEPLATGTTVRLPVGCTLTPPPRDQLTRAAFSVRNSRRSRPNARMPMPADIR